MKLKTLTLAALASIALYSCGGETKESTEETTTGSETTTEEPAAATSYALDTENSEVAWRGDMVKMYFHTGTLKFSEGAVEISGDKITGGSFVVDMNTMEATDENYSEENTPEMLIGHLKSADFFLVDSFSTAKFEITSVEGETFKGDMTIKGKTNPVEGTIASKKMEDGSLEVMAKMIVNRQDFGVAYSMGAADKVISDDLTLDITVKATK